jgi:hypothetical protein
MKSFNVQSLWDTNDGPSAGVPDYIVKKANDTNSPLKLNLPDGRFMIIEVEDLQYPYKISEPIPNRNFPSVGDVTYKYYNYLFKESIYSSTEVETPKEELLLEGNYNSFEDLKKIQAEAKVEEEQNHDVEVMEVSPGTAVIPKYSIRKEVVVTTVQDVPATLSEFIGNAIKTRREEFSLSTKEVVSKIVQNNPAHYKFSLANYEIIEGGNSNAKMRTLELICEALDLHISDIYPPKQ